MGLIQASKRAGFARLAPNLLSAIGEYIEQSRVVVSEYSEKGAKLLRPLLFTACFSPLSFRRLTFSL
jgi:geranylgeranyl pyrophosphate synthase